MKTHQSPVQNLLLGALKSSDYERLQDGLELVPLKLGDVLHEPGGKLRYCYFPATCMVSLLCLMEDGASPEIAVVGKEGMVGVAVFMSGGTMQNRAVVHTAGYAYRLRQDTVMREFNRYGGFLNLLLRYTQALIAQMAQTAVCNRHHTVDQQLCRWLLQRLDSQTGNELHTTQELIASMLGVRREGITEAAGNLQRAGLIDYRRGHITVVDRSKLEERVCECYHAVKTEFVRLLPSTHESHQAVPNQPSVSTPIKRSPPKYFPDQNKENQQHFYYGRAQPST
jgi:CRP-like cAMP-binding protein